MNNLLLRLLIVATVIIGAAVQAAPKIPSLSGRVVDSAGLLSASTRTQLTQQLASHESSTSNQLAVLTVPNLQGYAIEDFALEVARDWQLGQKDLNNGALLLVARDERKIRIEVGYGLEGDLTDARSKRIIQNEIRPAFKQGNFDAGVIAGVDAIIGTIEGTYTPPKSSSGGSDSPFIPIGFISLFGLAHFMQGRVKTQYINAVVGGGFAGAIIGLATEKWYFGVLAALVLGTLLSRAPSGRGTNRPGYRGPVGYDGDRPGESGFGSGGGFGGGFGGGGGGFGGGGGGFGGGGASGGW